MSEPSGPSVVVPGKLFLAGEYAVLEGGVAVLAAVSRYARGEYVPELRSSSRVVSETSLRVRSILRSLNGRPSQGEAQIDTSQFEKDGVKLGLGSSAAAAVAAAGVLLERAGLSLSTHRDLLYSAADAGHRAAQGGIGSGADVAAAVYGGFIRFCRSTTGPPRISQLTAPAGLHIVVFWTRAPAGTSEFVRAVRHFAEREIKVYYRVMDSLKASADHFVRAFSGNDAHEVIAAADRYREGLVTLGAAANIAIVTSPFSHAADRARKLGGSAKPSGAGGGDIGLAFFADPEAVRAFITDCGEDIVALDVGLGAKGAHACHRVTEETS